jgi:hypothetical protein
VIRIHELNKPGKIFDAFRSLAINQDMVFSYAT